MDTILAENTDTLFAITTTQRSAWLIKFFNSFTSLYKLHKLCQNDIDWNDPQCEKNLSPTEPNEMNAVAIIVRGI